MSWLSKLMNALLPGRLDKDLTDEMNDHQERRAAEFRASGMSEDEARHKASRLFGNTTALREQSRDLHLWAAVETALQDLRFAWRGLLRSPAVAATTVLSLGLAIGANTAIYSIVEAAILRPLPVPSPGRLFRLSRPSAAEGRDVFSYPAFTEFLATVGTGARLALFAPANRVEATIGPDNADQSTESVNRQFVSGEAFAVMQVQPALGRLFSAEEDRGIGTHPVTVLSYSYWSRRFHRDPAVLGLLIRLDGQLFRVQGIAGEGFTGIEPGKIVDAWTPVVMFDPGAFTNPKFDWCYVVGRLRPGVSLAQIQARLPAVGVLSAETGVSSFRDTFGKTLWIIVGVAVGILLIACSNVASLLLARSTAREGEMALRVSLGAGRLRLVRQLLTESLLLSALAGALGLVVARLATPILLAWMSGPNDPAQFEPGLNLRVLLFCGCVCTFAALFFGLAPAWQGTTARPAFGLRRHGTNAASLRAGRAFLTVQVAFAFCLVVVGAGFLLSLHNLVTVDTGFDPRGVSVLTIATKPGSLRLPALEELRRTIAGKPGVESVAQAWLPLFGGGRRSQRVLVAGRQMSQREETFYRVSPGYLSTVRTPLLGGRDLAAGETDAAQPVPSVVNVAFARKYFGAEDVVGREFQRDDGVRHRIVGLAANSRYGSLRGGPEPIVYFPMLPPRRFTLYVRSRLDPGSVMRLVDPALKSAGFGTHVVEATTLDALVGRSILKERLVAGLGGVFALLSLLLAAIGLFGLLNYSVTRRTKELGIRSALGAPRRGLILLVLRDLSGLLTVGLSAGLVGSIAVMNVSRSLLFGVSAADPLVMAAAAAVFLAVSATAGGLPARRAAAIDPMIALRHE